jgi:hypothetical protein
MFGLLVQVVVEGKVVRLHDDFGSAWMVGFEARHDRRGLAALGAS